MFKYKYFVALQSTNKGQTVNCSNVIVINKKIKNLNQIITIQDYFEEFYKKENSIFDRNLIVINYKLLGIKLDFEWFKWKRREKRC